ncbi:DMT family transporter [Pseudomonas sp. QE6]|uniref:DMT family transporter n=1 Tax=Pseudomonas sp. QE6 TaxID=3242491 RepID=UPI00352832C4
MHRPHLDSRLPGILCLLVTASGWAINWPAMKLLLQVWPPLFSRGLAGVIAAVVLIAIAALQGQRLIPQRQALPRLTAAAFTNVFAWMGFSTLAMKWINVSEGVLLVYTMPIWVTLLAWPLRGMRPTASGFAALLLGLAGVTVLLSAHGLSIAPGQALGVGFALAAAVLFALGTVLNDGPFPLAPIVSTAWQVGLGCLPMLLFGIVFEHPRLDALGPGPLACMAYMTFVPMGVCYLTWFGALQRLPASVAATGMLLVPLLGVLSAAVMLGDAIGTREVLAMTLTLSGVALVLKRR